MKTFEDSAEYCVNGTPESLVASGSFRGYNFDCQRSTCRCLYDEGTLDNRNSGRFDRTNRNEPGSGSVAGTTRKSSSYCAKLVGAEMLEGVAVEA